MCSFLVKQGSGRCSDRFGRNHVGASSLPRDQSVAMTTAHLATPCDTWNICCVVLNAGGPTAPLVLRDQFSCSLFLVCFMSYLPRLMLFSTVRSATVIKETVSSETLISIEDLGW